MIHEYTETKTCPRCNETKPSTDYAVDRSAKDGLKFICNTCSGQYTPTRPRISFDGVTKQCLTCRRTLPARAFSYSQKSPDRLTPKCRTCKRYRGTQPLTQQMCEAYEKNVSNIYESCVKDLTTKYNEPQPTILTKHRSELEEKIFKQMLTKGILHDWKPPEWIHETSIN